MDVESAIESRIEVRDYADGRVPRADRRAILNAGRLASSGRNVEHWRFILVSDESDLAELGRLSPSGGWISGADFAIVICTDPSYAFSDLDAGRAVTYMQLLAWERGIGSCIYTVDTPDVDAFLEIPSDQEIGLVAGFGYPKRDIIGRKNRQPLEDLAFDGKYGQPFDV